MPNSQLPITNYQIMNVIPAIDLLDGKCVRLYQGDYAKSQIFNDNPVEVARQWVNEGATMLHLVDLDGAKAGHPVNLAAIEAIVRAVDVPCQLGGGMRDRPSVAAILKLGVQRAILGTVAVEQPQLVGELCTEFPGQILVGIDARNGKVATREEMDQLSPGNITIMNVNKKSNNGNKKRVVNIKTKK